MSKSYAYRAVATTALLSIGTLLASPPGGAIESRLFISCQMDKSNNLIEFTTTDALFEVIVFTREGSTISYTLDLRSSAKLLLPIEQFPIHVFEGGSTKQSEFLIYADCTLTSI